MANETTKESYVNQNFSYGKSYDRGTPVGRQGNRPWFDGDSVVTHLHIGVSKSGAFEDGIDPSDYFGLHLRHWDRVPLWYPVRATAEGCAYSPGQDSSRWWLFQQAYDRVGGQAQIGCALGPTYWWNASGYWMVRQDFSGVGAVAPVAILHDEGRDNPPGTIRARVVWGGIWSYYRNNPIYGPAVSDEFTNPRGYRQSNFLTGYVWWDGAVAHFASYYFPDWYWLSQGNDSSLYLAAYPVGDFGVRLVLDGQGGSGGWMEMVWLQRWYYYSFDSPLYITWEQFDKAHSLHLAFWIEGTDMVKRVLVYSANAPNWWSAQGWVDMGVSPSYNQWASFARAILIA